MYWMMTFFAPLAMRRPLPLITPLVPIPMRDLLDPRSMALTPALSYLTLMEVAPAPALPLVHLSIFSIKYLKLKKSTNQEAWLIASCPPLPGHLLEAGRQPVSVTVPSLPMKLNQHHISILSPPIHPTKTHSLSSTITLGVESVSHVFNCAISAGY